MHGRFKKTLCLVLAAVFIITACACEKRPADTPADQPVHTDENDSRSADPGDEIRLPGAPSYRAGHPAEVSHDTGTESETEAPTETETEAPTETETEAPTEPETEAPTEPPAQTVPSYAPVADGAYVVFIDPGHQLHGDSTQEPMGPGSSQTKKRVSQGTQGVATGIPEYQLNLTISLMLQQELQANGVTVVMSRTTHDVNISNIERAQAANACHADAYIRIHADGNTDGSIRGAHTICMSPSNPWNSYLYSESRRLSDCVINNYCAATGIRSRGVSERDDMTGINWSEVPVTLLELGFMSNPDEDRLMNDPSFQQTMVQGITAGILEYLNSL